MDRENIKKRTEAFAVRVIKLANELPHGVAMEQVAALLLRSGTLIGAGYIRACHAQDRADELEKLAACGQSARETCYWLELMLKGEMAPAAPLREALDEAKQLSDLFEAETERA